MTKSCPCSHLHIGNWPSTTFILYHSSFLIKVEKNTLSQPLQWLFYVTLLCRSSRTCPLTNIDNSEHLSISPYKLNQVQQVFIIIKRHLITIPLSKQVITIQSQRAEWRAVFLPSPRLWRKRDISSRHSRCSSGNKMLSRCGDILSEQDHWTTNKKIWKQMHQSFKSLFSIWFWFQFSRWAQERPPAQQPNFWIISKTYMSKHDKSQILSCGYFAGTGFTFIYFIVQ